MKWKVAKRQLKLFPHPNAEKLEIDEEEYLAR